MYSNIALTVGVFVLAALLGWLAWRAWHARNPFAKWGGGILASLLTLVVAAVGVMAAIGLVKWLAPPATAVSDLKVAGTPQQVERGRYIANSLCVECHTVSHQLPLTGGEDFAKQIPIPVGSFTPPNLTPAGSLKNWSDGQIFRELRTGVDDDGHHLVLMSTVPVRNLSDEDIQAVIAYLRSQPVVENQTPDPPDQPSFLGLVMFGAGMLPGGLPPVKGVVTAPPMGPTVEYGQYIVGYAGCRDCHGENLTGGDPKSLGAHGPSLRIVKGWTADQFIKTLRTGIDPNGHALSAVMPWRVMGRLDDNDLTAVYQYVTSLQ
ncbi:MAG TPA: cytochrome c [Anaerolineales bacterium]